MTVLWLIRHGQTDWNVEGRYQGQADLPLNEAGILQAESAAAQVARLPVAAIFASDLVRAHRTAEIIAARLGLPVQEDARLREINQGEWEGLLVSEIASRYAGQIGRFRANPMTARAPGGETVAEVASRLASAANEISRRYAGQQVLIVSHGLALATLIARARKVPLDQVYALIPENAVPHCIEWPSGVE